MHHRSSRPLLALLILILASLACSTSTRPINEKEKTYGNVICTRKENNPFVMFDTNPTYICTCPSSPGQSIEFALVNLQNIGSASLEAQACAAPAASNQTAPTEPPTEEPALPTEPPTDPAPLQPYLTGAFTTCDNVAGYVNFSIAEDAPAYDPATFKVTFNGYPVNCAPAANNPSVLTCNYPPPSYAPPAGVQVFIGEELVNEFDFNGGEICNPAQPPNTNNNGEEQPAPTEEPTPTD